MISRKRLKNFINFHRQNGLKNKRDSLEKLVKDFPNTPTAKKVEELLAFEKPRPSHNEDKTKTITATYNKHNGTHVWLVIEGEEKKVKKEKFSKHDLELLKLYFGY